jgi:bacterioferritin-associated ferredoxin
VAERAFVCRCEDVTLAELDHTLARGLSTVEEIKRYTGLGTGPCQGKECVGLLCKLLIARGVLAPAAAQPFTARPPVEPVTFGSLAAGVTEDDPQ